MHKLSRAVGAIEYPVIVERKAAIAMIIAFLSLSDMLSPYIRLIGSYEIRIFLYYGRRNRKRSIARFQIFSPVSSSLAGGFPCKKH